MDNLIKVQNGTPILDAEVCYLLADYARQIKSLNEMQDKYKQAILEEMEQNNIIKIETENLSINYIAPTDRETFDKKAFKKDHPLMYDDYVEMEPVKASIRIKVK